MIGAFHHPKPPNSIVATRRLLRRRGRAQGHMHEHLPSGQRCAPRDAEERRGPLRRCPEHQGRIHRAGGRIQAAAPKPRAIHRRGAGTSAGATRAAARCAWVAAGSSGMLLARPGAAHSQSQGPKRHCPPLSAPPRPAHQPLASPPPRPPETHTPLYPALGGTLPQLRRRPLRRRNKRCTRPMPRHGAWQRSRGLQSSSKHRTWARRRVRRPTPRRASTPNRNT